MVVLAIVPDESVQLLVAVTARGLVPLLLTTTLGGKHVGAPAGGTTVMLNPWLAANPLESVACTVKLKIPAATGVPASAPVVLKVIPGGRG